MVEENHNYDLASGVIKIQNLHYLNFILCIFNHAICLKGTQN